MRQAEKLVAYVLKCLLSETTFHWQGEAYPAQPSCKAVNISANHSNIPGHVPNVVHHIARLLPVAAGRWGEGVSIITSKHGGQMDDDGVWVRPLDTWRGLERFFCFVLFCFVFHELWERFHPFRGVLTGSCSWEVRSNPSVIKVTKTGVLSQTMMFS